MNKVKIAVVAALLATISVSTYADEKMLEMATQKGCFICLVLIYQSISVCGLA